MFEPLPQDYQSDMEKLKKEKENTIGCRLKIEEGIVKVTIPKHRDTEGVTLTFSKREVKELLQDLYIN